MGALCYSEKRSLRFITKVCESLSWQEQVADTHRAVKGDKTISKEFGDLVQMEDIKHQCYFPQECLTNKDHTKSR